MGDMRIGGPRNFSSPVGNNSPISYPAMRKSGEGAAAAAQPQNQAGQLGGADQQANPMQQLLQAVMQLLQMIMSMFGMGGAQQGAQGADGAAGAPGGAEGIAPGEPAPNGAQANNFPDLTGGVNNTAAAGGGQGVTQGGIPYISQYNPGSPNAAANCGPASVAMIARGFGKGAGMDDAALMNHLADVGGTTKDGSSINGIVAMAQDMGLSAEAHGPHADLNWIDQQLGAGKKVCANGDYYAEPGHNGGGRQSGHYLDVVGKDANGNYQIQDPADGSLRTMTPEQLTRFINANPVNGGYCVAIGQ